MTDWIESIAGAVPLSLEASSSLVGSSKSEVAIQCRTSAIVRSVALVAANSSAARYRAPAGRQNASSAERAALWSPTPSSAAAVRRAPVHDVDALSGDHTACPSEVAWVGSKTRASPSSARAASVW